MEDNETTKTIPVRMLSPKSVDDGGRTSILTVRIKNYNNSNYNSFYM